MISIMQDQGNIVYNAHSLEGTSGSHNLCVVGSVTSEAIRKGVNAFNDGLLYAVGGQFRSAQDPRGKQDKYDGIKLYVLRRWKSGNEHWWQAVMKLVDGHHPGCIDNRSKCKGVAEFDGQSSLTYFQGKYYLYARANPKEAGWRSVQVCFSEDLHNWGPFAYVPFQHVAQNSDIYFVNAYCPPPGRAIVVIFPMALPAELEGEGGIYRALSFDGLTFHEPFALLKCKVYKRRTYDLPVNGSVSFDPEGITFCVHKNVPCRMPTSLKLAESLERIYCKVPPHYCLWSQSGLFKQNIVCLFFS
jgi:hypothetical protein